MPLGPGFAVRWTMAAVASGASMTTMGCLVGSPVRRVLLAIDLSDVSRAPVDVAIQLAARDHAALVVFSVLERRNLRLPGGRARRVDQERSRLERGVGEVVRHARELGVATTYLIREGEPAESIVEASITEGVDLIVMGARRRPDLRRLMTGSVSSGVTSSASCRVLVVTV